MHRFEEITGINSPKNKNMLRLVSSEKETVTSRFKKYLCRWQ